MPNMKAYLHEYSPSILLSLHPPWFKKREEDSKAIIDVLKAYKYIFYINGSKLILNKLFDVLLHKKDSFSVVATNREYKRLPYFLKRNSARLIYKIKTALPAAR